MRLEQDGVELGSVSEFRSPDYPADAVVSQDPPPDAKAPQVSLLLNRGEQSTTYVMPDVIGMDGDARRRRAARPRVPRRPSSARSRTRACPPGTVVRQQPQGGFPRRRPRIRFRSR